MDGAWFSERSNKKIEKEDGIGRELMKAIARLRTG